MRLIPAVDRALREAEERAECQRAEESMRESEHKYRELFECLNDAAFLADAKTGKIIDSNRAAENLLSRNRAEILGHNQSEFLALDKTLQQSEETFPAGAQKNSSSKCKLIRADNTRIPVNVRATRFTLYGQPLFLWLCYELTESRSA
jgi:PAS domain S-box-containing protein